METGKMPEQEIEQSHIWLSPSGSVKPIKYVIDRDTTDLVESAVKKYLKPIVEDIDDIRTKVNLLGWIGRKYIRPTQLFDKDMKPISSNIIDYRRTLLLKAQQVLNKLEQDFDDLPSRLDHLLELKNIIKEVWHTSRDQTINRDLIYAASTVSDALKFLRASDMTLDQVTTLRESISYLKKTSISRDDVRALNRLLKRAGFSTLPLVNE